MIFLPTSLRLAIASTMALYAVTLPANAAPTNTASNNTSNETAVQNRLQQLESELNSLKTELSNIKQASTTAASEKTEAKAAANDTTLFSYGEINYNRPTHDSNAAQADARRIVLGLEHRMDTRTKAVIEIEFEHAVTAAPDDPGEVAVEQAFVEHQINNTLSARGGLFLIPMGLLNENHEPTAFYGVERNYVETAIIPSTWREGGFALIGALDNGLTLEGGVSTGFALGKWDATGTDGQESPLASVHQELAQAKAKDLSFFAAANWRGIPGLQLGVSAFTGGVGQDEATLTDSRLFLWDAHARWTPGKWDVSALYARGTLSNTASFNQTLVGNPTLVPELFEGRYVQVAYQLWANDNYKLAPFARMETYNTGASYADIGAGLTPDTLPTQHVTTVGANIGIGQGVVVKMDIQRSHSNSALDRFDLGLGWSF